MMCIYVIEFDEGNRTDGYKENENETKRKNSEINNAFRTLHLLHKRLSIKVF